MAEQTTSNCTPRGFTTQESKIRRCGLKTGKDTGVGAIGRAINGVRTTVPAIGGTRVRISLQPELYPYRSLGGKLSMTPSWEDKVVLKSVLPVKET